MLLLIGGGSSVGKTTAARALAAGLQLPHVQLDELLNAPEFDQILGDSDMESGKQEQQLRESLIRKGDAALAGLPRWLGQHSSERGILLEGEGIHPGFHEDLGDLPGVRLLFIVELDAETLRDTLMARSKSFRTLPTSKQSSLVAANILYNEWIAEEASTYGQSLIPSQPWSSLPARLLRCL